MKNTVCVLDCTLREAPIDDLMWGKLSIMKTIHGLELAGVEIIEVGFLKNNTYKSGSTSFQKVEEIKEFIKPKKKDVIYVALVDYGRYNLDYLSPYDGTSIDAIRVCFKHSEINQVLEYAQKIVDKGYKVCIQHVDTLGYSETEIVDFINRVNKFMPFAYSIVDTFGAMYQKDMIRIAKLVDEKLDDHIKLGFHGHNNLMLADSNAQRFVEEIGNHREIIIDSSLYGCGRSAGNAHTELITQYLNSNFGCQYDIDELLDLIDVVISAAKEKATWGYSIPYFIAGMYNAHTFNVNHLLRRHNIKSKDLRGIIEQLDSVQKKAYDYALLEKLYVDYFDNSVDDKEVIITLTNNLKEKNILVLAPGPSVIKDKELIMNYIEKCNPIVIGVNNIIEGYRFDYVFYSGALRYKNLQYQSYRNAGSPKIIVTSNIKQLADYNEMVIDYKSLIKFGWINIDSSAILLFRLLVKCGVYNISVAGLDGYSGKKQAFYTRELDMNLSINDMVNNTNDNISMLKDIQTECSQFNLNFITDSIYKECFKGEYNV